MLPGEEHLREAIRLSERVKDVQSLGLWTGNLGYNRLAANEVAEATGLFRKALELSKRVGDRDNERRYAGGLAEAERRSEEIRKARRSRS